MSSADKHAGPEETRRRHFWTTGTMLLAMAVLVAAVAGFSGSYWLSIFTSAFAASIAIAGIGLLYGQLGLVSLSQFALVGVGGWVALRVQFALNPPFEVSVLTGGLAASAIGVLWGSPALRLRGLHLALVTLMLAGAFQVVIGAWGFPDGGSGFLGRADGGARMMMQRPLLAQGDVAYCVYVGICLAAVLLVVQLHQISKPGRAWALIRRDLRMARSSGVRIVFYKTWAFALAGFFAGIAGGLLAGSIGQLDGRAFAASDSLMLFAIAIVGGVTHWLGPIMAGVALRVAPALLSDIGVNGYLAQCIFGTLLIHALLSGPSGVSGQLLGALARLRSILGGRQLP